MEKLKLSILDQSPISEGMSAEQALQHTVDLVQHAEQWGYSRFWVSEHHDSETLAGSSPEVLIAHLAAKTSRIRIGSGGVMLTHYSPYKVAENFRVLEGLTPNRIDLGVGRAPGGMPRATYALHNGEKRNIESFPEQIDELFIYLHDAIAPSDKLYGLKAAPVIQTVPELWLLGSSHSSALLAAEKGLPYNFAQFINGEDGPQYSRYYKERFKPSSYLTKPKNMVTVFVTCAETDEEAQRINSSIELAMIRLEQGMPSAGTPSPETAMAYSYSKYEWARVLENRKRMIIGSPKKVKEALYELSEQYGTDEIMLVSNMYSHYDKLKSFELIAKELL
ncbi:LLM class flavin-dependent oxidoreductase [Heyndrickxia ginsengihumi]|jgi:luciferase family oxidoreductase group 1|uniref:LLM class flavin-dependent oxidoreductase n=1 Tax=Heyndrickxia ginsengihumi TaxID=363870 RepID=A0A0A6VEQ9_9BACI|nr:LLM class flavin-dependent oxidoreductase [Heyndrickxia ginsengihumi]KHD85948.1 hypothetical protein NG54_06135 [Heyndrickxia ginsengihumi]MCM3022090.1 LLM class flavin-dependent oxidoreductase [Heyndrickxia ginsengihumi]NEY21009.1 LLM class flavin-dependent oxidoreductase [Heyndrickxia ginsengihumi]